jgi:hypothetical protein
MRVLSTFFHPSIYFVEAYMQPESPNSQKCPYCDTTFNLLGVGTNDSYLSFEPKRPGSGPPGYTPGYVPERQKSELGITCHRCPACGREIIWLNKILLTLEDDGYRSEIKSRTLLLPKYPVYHVPEGVPEPLASDFREAHDTLTISPKASAALSRRCLQAIIEGQENIRGGSLMAQVKTLIALNKIPLSLAEELDMIRVAGNFAAHPKKDENTGEIVEVGPDEAGWTFQLLERLLQFYFVEQPKFEERRRVFKDKFGDKAK